MNKRGELKNNDGTSFGNKVGGSKTVPRAQGEVSRINEELSRKKLKRAIAEMLAEMKLGSGKVIAAFQALTREMLEKNYEVSWGYGRLYPFEMLKEVTAYLQSKVKGEYRLLFEGKIIVLNCGFFKSDFPETDFAHRRIDFKTLSHQLAKSKHLTHWLLPGEEPEFVNVYVIPTICLQNNTQLYFIAGDFGRNDFVSGGFAERLSGTHELALRLTSDLLRKKMLHAIPTIQQTPKTGVNVRIPFRRREGKAI